MKKVILTAVISVLATGSVITYGMFWSAARDEAYYLCGNFAPGITRASVVRQLNTANLSDYQEETIEGGSVIRFSSPLTLRYYQCVIEIDEGAVVSRSYFQPAQSS